MLLNSLYKIKRQFVFTFFIFLFATLICNTCYSQELSSIRGVVRNARTGEFIPYAAIYARELKIGITADIEGFFYLDKVEQGKYHFIISSLGYKDLDTLLDIAKDRELDIYLVEKELTVGEVIVTAEPSKSLATSSVIKQDALRHLQPNSFADILELLPGGITRKNDMTAMKLITLRQPLKASGLSQKGNEHNSSLGTAFVIDGIPISNDAQLQNVTGASAYRDNSIMYRNTTGKGIDMRLITTDDIEKVEIVRGIPSVKYGELTSGLVNIKRSYIPKPLRMRIKATPSMKLAAIGKGFVVGEHTLNTNLDYIHYLSDPRNVKVNYSRMTASLRYANAKSVTTKPLFFNASLDYTGSFDKSRRDEENDTKDESYKNEYNNIRLASRLIWQKKATFFDKLEASLSGSYTANKKIVKRIAVGRMSPILSETKEGEYYGAFLPASYPAHLEIDDKPFYLYAKIGAQFHTDINIIRNKIFLGADWRYQKNFGEGEIFDIRRPLFSSNGRPRRSKDIPAMQSLAFYAEDNISLQLGKSKLNAQFGVRAASLLGLDKKYNNLHNKFYFDPRVNISFAFPEFQLSNELVRLSIYAGFGWHTKMPTLSHLYPNKKYFDKVQLNYYSQNKDLRQMQYKVKVIDPTSYQLKPNRNKKWELGLTAKVGKIFFEVNAYKEMMEEGFRHLSHYTFFNYRNYNIASGPKPSELSAPPTVDMFDYESHSRFVLYSQYTNGGVEEKIGVEYTLNLGNIPAIKSDVSINGAWMKMQYGQSLPRYSSSSTVIGGKDYPYIGYYEWDDTKSYQQFNTNIRFDTKIERLGLIFSSTFQTLWYTLWKNTPNNGMPTYYIDRDNKQYPYMQKDSTDPILRFLYDKPYENQFAAMREPIAIDYNLKVSKTISKHIDLGFYVNSLLHYYADVHRPGGFVVKRDSSPYFGMELHVKL